MGNSSLYFSLGGLEYTSFSCAARKPAEAFVKYEVKIHHV